MPVYQPMSPGEPPNSTASALSADERSQIAARLRLSPNRTAPLSRGHDCLRRARPTCSSPDLSASCLVSNRGWSLTPSTGTASATFSSAAWRRRSMVRRCAQVTPTFVPTRTRTTWTSSQLALRVLKARIRTEGVEGGLPFSCDAAFLLARVALLNLETEAGDLDVCFIPTGTRGYDDLIAHVARFDLDGVVAPTAALLDIIRSKTRGEPSQGSREPPDPRSILPASLGLARVTLARSGLPRSSGGQYSRRAASCGWVALPIFLGQEGAAVAGDAAERVCAALAARPDDAKSWP